MAIVTFMSDFGEKDHYVSVVKATMLKLNPGIQIVDISHWITPFDIGHAAFVLNNAFRHFPSGTVHLIAMEPSHKQVRRSIAIKLEDHFFVGSDTGIFSLISELPAAAKVELNSRNSTFVAKDVLAPIAVQLAIGKSIHEMGARIDNDLKLFSRKPKLTRREMVGHVIRVDYYGNLISNLMKSDFIAIQKINGNVPFTVQIGREVYVKFHDHYDEVEPGECYLIFNSNGNLQIGINKGNAAELLGLYIDYPIYIQFNQ